MIITGSIQEKNGRWHMVINRYDEKGERKPKWKSTGLPSRGNKRQAEKMLSETLAELNKLNVPYQPFNGCRLFQGLAGASRK